VGPSSNATQVVPAAENSTIAGSTVEFPPGAVAIATEITIQPGANIATPAVAQELKLGNQVASAAAAVTVSSSTPMDTAQAFTVSIPIPDDTALRLVGDDPFERLVVLYRVQDVGAGSEKVGYVTRSKLEVVNGFAKLQSRHFGTFQAIFVLTVPPEPSKEIPAEKIPEVAEEPPEEKEGGEPPTAVRPTRIRFVRGAAASIFDENLSRSDGFGGWVPGLLPARVSIDMNRLETGAVIRKRLGE
jgi:hypothetical protein